MKRWPVVLLSLTTMVVIATGCQQKCFIAEKDFSNAQMLPAGLEDGNALALIEPTKDRMAAPATVDHPNRPPSYMTLQEAIALALENGATGARNGLGPGLGTINDDQAVFTGGSLNLQSDRMRVLALQPAIAGASIEAALSRFDALSVTSLTWTNTDEPSINLNAFNNGSQANFNTSIVKALPSGGVVNTSFTTLYTLLNTPPAVAINPNWTARLSLGFEQPLLRNFGSQYAQLAPRVSPITGVTMPAQAANGFNTQQSTLGAVAGQPVEGILISRLRFDQSRAEFERQVHNLLLNVETAYWNLYKAYGTLYANEQVSMLLHRLWNENYLKAQAGSEKSPADLLAQIRGQFEEFRGERTNALGQVLVAERNLRRFIGMDMEDGTRIVPVTSPTKSQFKPDWDTALSDALTQRPELVLVRDNLRFHELALIREKNSLYPDLRLVAKYEPLGVGTRLSGTGTFIDNVGNPQPANAFANLSSGHFNDYTVGLNLSVPLGFRFEHAAIRTAKAQLAQAYWVLKDQEDRVKSTLVNEYQNVDLWYRLIEQRTAERRAYADSLVKKLAVVEVGRKPIDLDILDVQRRLALALTKEFEAIAVYNTSLAKLEFARGTIMQHDNIVIAESGLPVCAEVRAVEHERERTKALILRQPPPNALAQPGLAIGRPDMPIQPDEAPLPKVQETPLAPPADAGAETQKPAVPMILDAPPPLKTPEPEFKAPKPKPASPDDKFVPPAPKETTPTTGSASELPPLLDIPNLNALPALPAEKLPTMPTKLPASAPATAKPPVSAPPTTARPSPAPPANVPSANTPRSMSPPSTPPAPTSTLPPPPPIPDVINDSGVPALPLP